MFFGRYFVGQLKNKHHLNTLYSISWKGNTNRTSMILAFWETPKSSNENMHRRKLIWSGTSPHWLFRSTTVKVNYEVYLVYILSRLHQSNIKGTSVPFLVSVLKNISNNEFCNMLQRNTPGTWPLNIAVWSLWSVWVSGGQRFVRLTGGFTKVPKKTRRLVVCSRPLWQDITAADSMSISWKSVGCWAALWCTGGLNPAEHQGTAAGSPVPWCWCQSPGLQGNQVHHCTEEPALLFPC